METQNTELDYSSSEDSVASASSLMSVISDDTDVNISQPNITSAKKVDPLRSLNKELSDKMELLENQNIPEFLQNLLFIKDKLPLINDQLELKYLDKKIDRLKDTIAILEKGLDELKSRVSKLDEMTLEHDVYAYTSKVRGCIK